MVKTESKGVTPLSLIVDFVLVAAFFAYLFTLLRAHVPSTDPTMITVWAALGASCMAGVFWLCIQMFRVVLRGQLEAKRK